MKNYFTLQEFSLEPLPFEVEIKLEFHRYILNEIREELGVPIIISQHSGYRSREYELSRGRSGNSQHTFKGLGAVDVTTRDLVYLRRLHGLLLASIYTRVAIYPEQNFIHCDFKGKKRLAFTSDRHSNWKRIKRS